MDLSLGELSREASASGFDLQSLEKVLRMLSLLDAIARHPFLKQRIALKGGTAINLFHFPMPRLSVDIDLNILGGADPAHLSEDRPKIEQSILAVCSREELSLGWMSLDHAGGKIRLAYVSVTGGTGRLELDLNFMLRTPLWPCVLSEGHPIGAFRTAPVRVLDLHELTVGKIVALLARSATRDIFDANALLSLPELAMERLRLGFVVYGGINRRDWRTVSTMDVTAEPSAVMRDLVPMLRKDLAPGKQGVAAWTNSLVSECREKLACLLPLSKEELEFLTMLNDFGEIHPELITGDITMQALLENHPGLRWKALNVRKYRGLDACRERNARYLFPSVFQRLAFSPDEL